ncbi:IMPACT family protein [Kocuria sp.]|uniref:IMPACT family protein n=1 Tax=Kocuria sp. TaxID=1871328 RepID=UPI0026E0B8A9|nr:YigZ family protein [Kocuria sp.]MDO5617732.1 YigZ family protein [Kocuria sp.]
MPQRYTVLDSPAEIRHQIEIKKSRFLTVLKRIESEDQATDLLADLRREFHDARHHCSAWVLGPDRRLQRSSDDGEPSGTAGVPMLEAITQRRTEPGGAAESLQDDLTDLSDVCAVVVRWFGGTLLGAGGLVRAYSDSVSQALDQAAYTQRARMAHCDVPASLAEAARWENELRSAGIQVLDTSWAAHGATLHVATHDTPSHVAELEMFVAQLTSGTAPLVQQTSEWMDLPAA